MASLAPSKTKEALAAELPQEWNVRLIGEFSELGSGTTPLRSHTPSYFEGGKTPWVKTGDLNNGVVTATEERITEKAVSECGCRIYPPGTVLVAMYGGFRQIGRTGLLDINAAINQALTAIRLNGSEIDPKFLQNWLNRRVLFWRRFAASSRKDPNITKQDIGLFPVPIPPLGVQVRINTILELWDNRVQMLERLMWAKQELKRGLMQQLLTGIRRFKGFSKPWKEFHLDELVVAVDRLVEWDENELYKLASVRRWSGGLFLRDQLYGHQIKVKKLKTIKQADFLISHIQSAYGAMALVPEEFDGTKVSDLYTVLVSREPKKFDIRFLNYLSQCRRMWHLAYLASNGFFAERLRLNFNPADFLKHSIRIPTDMHEQWEIVSTLEAITKEIELLQKQLDLFKKQKRGLMQRLLTGKIRVKI